MTDGFGRIPPVPADDDDEWMDLFSPLPDEDLDALLEGGPGAARRPSAVGDVLEVLRADARRHGAPPMGLALRAQIAAPSLSGAARRRRALAAGAFGLLLGTSVAGVAAAENVLPRVLQDAASSAAGLVGVEVPRAAERSDDDPVSTERSRAQAADDEGTDSAGAHGGPPASTPSGAVPADPGTSGDGEPATPAVPPAETPDAPDKPETTPPATPAVPGGGGQPATPATPPSTVPDHPRGGSGGGGTADDAQQDTGSTVEGTATGRSGRATP